MKNMDVFYHLLYEHSRGLRDLALYTISPDDETLIAKELQLENVSFLFRKIEDGRTNVYFGHPSCVEVVKSFGTCPHCYLSPEQDFILGIMLGYDRTRQCDRYLTRRDQCEARSIPCQSTQPSSSCVKEKDDEHALL